MPTLQDLKISIVPGMLSISDHRGDETILPEATMDAYRKFYTNYLLAIESIKDSGDAFIEAWCFNDRFRKLTIEALINLGLEKPERFTPSQLEALLISHEGKAGLIFQLHNTFPKSKQLETKPPPRLNPINLVFLKLRTFFVSQMGTLVYPL